MNTRASLYILVSDVVICMLTSDSFGIFKPFEMFKKVEIKNANYFVSVEVTIRDLGTTSRHPITVMVTEVLQARHINHTTATMRR